MATYWAEEVPITAQGSGLKVLYYRQARVLRFLRSNGKSMSLANWAIQQEPKVLGLLEMWLQDMTHHEAAMRQYAGRGGSTG